jgi:hypothetical protein
MEAMRWMTTILALVLAFGQPAQAQESPNQARFVVVVRDITESFPYLKDGDNFVNEKIVPNLGPNDVMAMFNMGTFGPKHLRLYQFPKLKIDDWKLELTTLRVWKMAQSRLVVAWKETAKLRNQCSQWLASSQAHKRQKGGYSELYRLLGYVSTYFETIDAEEKHLIIYSDLINTEQGKGRSILPPKVDLPFTGVNVHLLYVPFDDSGSWEEREGAWRRYFDTAKTVRMLSPAQCDITPPILRSPEIPFRLEKP